MRIIPFGKLTEILDEQEIFNPKLINSSQLLVWLHENFPKLKNETFIVAINAQIAETNDEIVLDDKDEISLLPPFSGG